MAQLLICRAFPSSWRATGSSARQTFYKSSNTSPIQNRSSRSLTTLYQRKCVSNRLKSITSTRKLRSYSTKAPPEDNLDDLDDVDDEEVPTTLAEMHGLDDTREEWMEDFQEKQSLPILTDEEKKFVRHRISPSGKIVLPPGYMIGRYYLNRKTVVIAGGRGWLGHALNQVLQDRGYEVRIFLLRFLIVPFLSFK
jgi:hypothetical protein